VNNPNASTNIDCDNKLPNAIGLVPDKAIVDEENERRKLQQQEENPDANSSSSKKNFTNWRGADQQKPKKPPKPSGERKTVHKYCVIFNPKPPLPIDREFYSLDDENNVVENYPKVSRE
tara:strand:+ start:574 stop:930 length:357 start_codon:yes stop_codon:yes gene_type:complete